MGAIFPNNARPVSPILQDRIIGYFQGEDEFIAGRVLPKVPTSESTGTIISIDSRDTHGDVMNTLIRGARSGYYRPAGPRFGTLTWNCEEFGIEAQVDDRQAKNAQVSDDLAMLESRLRLRDLKIWQERRTAALLFNTSVFTQSVTLAGGDLWTAATSDPIDDIATAVETVENSIGRKPNTIIFGRAPARALTRNAAILSYMPSDTNRNYLAEPGVSALMRDLFDLNTFVGKAVYNSANPGQAAATLTAIWGNMVWIGYLDGAGVASAGNSVSVDANAAIQVVEEDIVSEEYREERVRATIYRHRHCVDEVVTSAISGYTINTPT